MILSIQHEDHDSIVFIKEHMDSKDLVFNFHNVNTYTIKKTSAETQL